MKIKICNYKRNRKPRPIPRDLQLFNNRLDFENITHRLKLDYFYDEF